MNAVPFFLIGFILSGCQQASKEHLKNLAHHSSLDQSIVLKTQFFDLLSWGKDRQTATINIYIEGDGQAWLDPWTISTDPTPPNPMGFKLALADNRPESVLYLTRPCQYMMDRRCTPLDWTTHRFSQKVISAYSQALDQIKEAWGNKTFRLHGYSGGATVALLIAAARHDIQSVITFAPLLDPTQWVKHHQYSPLSGSLSPLNQAVYLKRVPQDHFIGVEDEEVPPLLSTTYFHQVPESPIVHIHKVPHFHHYSDWPMFWKSSILNK